VFNSSGLSSAQLDAWQIIGLGPIPMGDAATAVANVVENGAPAQVSPVHHEIAPIASLDWSELAATVRVCSQCGLSAGRRNALVGLGSQKATWMVLSEAPDENEDISGEPFAGPAGQLLDGILQAVGLQRERDVFLTHVVKCRPAGAREPLPTERSSCQPYWHQEVRLLRPSKIIVLGRIAAQAVLGAQAPTAPSVTVQVALDGLQIPVVVTYHPSYLIRHPEHKHRAWQDWLLAKSI
jgi:uracil-DNA glycosylase